MATRFALVVITAPRRAGTAAKKIEALRSGSSAKGIEHAHAVPKPTGSRVAVVGKASNYDDFCWYAAQVRGLKDNKGKYLVRAVQEYPEA